MNAITVNECLLSDKALSFNTVNDKDGVKMGLMFPHVRTCLVITFEPRKDNRLNKQIIFAFVNV